MGGVDDSRGVGGGPLRRRLGGVGRRQAGPLPAGSVADANPDLVILIGTPKSHRRRRSDRRHHHPPGAKKETLFPPYSKDLKELTDKLQAYLEDAQKAGGPRRPSRSWAAAT